MSSYATEKLRTFDLLFHQLKNFPLEKAFSHKVHGSWVSYSTKKSILIINQLSRGLLELGLRKGDKVAIVSENRPEWNFVDFACQQIGVVVVPLYPTISTSDYQYIFDHAEVQVAFISSSEILYRVEKALPETSLKGLFTFNKVDGYKNWTEVLVQGKEHDTEDLMHIRHTIAPDDLMTIVYTSGTTDHPKGVMLSHRNLVSNVLGTLPFSTLEQGKDCALSFLPLNHVFERTGVLFYIYQGVAIYYAESMDTIADNLQEIKPHIFNTVPRLLEKVYDRIVKKGHELGGLKKGVFNRAITLGLKYEPNTRQGAIYEGQLDLADKLVFSKWREALGGNIKQIQCGAAALQPRLTRVFWAAGIRLLEGYGLTETSPVIAANSIDKIRVGTVGMPISDTEIRLAEDAEIEVKGPGVMMGYYKNETLTREVMTEDGWFRTGDIGLLVKDGYLMITDRKKEVFKTSGGLYITPQQIENKLKESVYIEQAMIIGEGRKFPAALIVPNMDEVMGFMSKSFEMVGDRKEMADNNKVIRLLEKEIERVNENLGKWAGVKSFRIVPDQWSLESGELTATLKLKRRVVLEKYEELIAEIYKGDGAVTFEEEEMADSEIPIDQL